MVPIFNIASTGHSGTKWLTNLLNGHPRIMCFHGLRADPYRHPNDIANPDNWLTPEEVRAAFTTMQSRTVDSKIIGTCHTFYDYLSRECFVENGGGFAVIYRDLFQRIQSGLCHHYSARIGRDLGGKDLYADIMVDFTESEVDLEKEPDLEQLNEKEQLFFRLVRGFIAADYTNFSNIPAAEYIIFEKMISDEEYLIDCLARLLQCSPDEFGTYFSNKQSYVINQHSLGHKLTNEEIFDIWPHSFRQLFCRVMRDCGGFDYLHAEYKKLEYTFPDNALDFISSR